VHGRCDQREIGVTGETEKEREDNRVCVPKKKRKKTDKSID